MKSSQSESGSNPARRNAKSGPTNRWSLTTGQQQLAPASPTHTHNDPRGQKPDGPAPSHRTEREQHTASTVDGEPLLGPPP
jgi:hypothetical protein